MPALNEPGSGRGNFFAGAVLYLCGGFCALSGILRLFDGKTAAGTVTFAGGMLLVVLSWRGHTNFRGYLAERAQRDDDWEL